MSDALSDEWEALEQAETKFSQWMSKLDRRLRDMEGAAAESHIGSEFVGKLMGRLKKLEQEMATQFDYCKNFAENGHKMVDKLGADTEYGIIILKKLDKMKEVWDETVQRLDTLGHIVTKLNELSLEDESVHEEGEQSDTRSESSSKSQKQQQSSPPVSVHKQPVSPVIPIDKSPKKSHHHLQSRIPPPTRYKETRPGDSASSSSSAKKPKLDRLEELGGQIQEWQKSLDSFANWLKTVEELLSIGEDETSDNQSLPWFQMSIENQQYILNDTISDLKTRKDEYDKLVEQGKKFEDDLALYNANTSDISEIVDAIKERWTEIENVLEKRKTYHLHLIEVSKIAKETEKISNVLKNVEEFLKNSPEKKTGDVLLRMQENCVERMRILKNYEIKIDDWISQLTKILEQEPSIEDDPIFIATVNSFKLWEEMVDKLESMRKRIDVLTNKGKNVTSESNADIRELTDGIMALVDWLEEIKSVEFGESLIIPTNQDDLDKQLNQLKELEKSFRSEEITYNQVRESTLEVIRSNLKTSRIRELESKLENLNKLWAECNQELDHRLTKLDEISMRITNLEYDIDQLEAWLEELDDFLLENPAYGDIQTLENQIEQCDVVLEQIKSSAELEDINNKLQEILDAVGELESDLPSLLEKKMEELNDRWLSIKNRANKKKLGLEAALTKAKSAFDELEKLENDLKSVSFETDEFSNSLVDDYKQIRITGEKLKEKLIILTSQASELEKMASNLCPEPEMITQSLEQARARVDLIVKTIEKLDKQISVTQLALKNSNLDYGEFKRLVRMEKEWLGGLERKLKRSPQSAADAEEISGNLDDLETYIRHRSESRCEKINELGKKLTQLSFMTESIAADMSHITKQWEMLHHQTQERLDDLEASVSDAQKCEQQVLRVQRWIESVDTQLQQWQEDDIAADDVPHEVERLEETFEENRNILEKLKGSIENYRSRERLEAATRLGEQLNVLNTQYLELVEKLKKFKHPSGFETRINIISKNLHQMLSNLQNLKVTSHESHVIQDELLECHSMIKEIKNFRKEMDRVSSQGKLALETSEDPSLLKIKLDKIRDLFDTVSKQAIQRRKELEHLLSMSEEISSEMLSIESWLNQQENPLSIDKTVFVVWQQKLEELTDKVQSFNRISSGQSMPLLNKTLSTIQSDFELLRRKMVLRSNNSEEREPSLEPTKESSEISSKERMAEMLFGSLDSAQSSLKSTSSRKSSLTPKTVDSISSLPKVYRPLDFFTTDELKMIHDDIKRAQNILDTDETLNSGDYKSHAEQREKLRCIQDLIEPNKPKITKIVSEKYMISKLHPESEDMIPVISILLSDWKAIRKRFLRRHRRWWFAKETMKEFEVSRKQINNFLEMVKDPIAETRLPTEELNIEVARRNYPRLLSYFSDYISTYGTFQAMTRKLSNNLSEKAEEIYKQIITTTDQRWNEVVQELAWQKQRLYNEERNLDLQLYWNELEQWMDKVNSTISKLHEGIDSFEDANILENEIKNFEKEIPEQWLNQKTISSAPTTVIGKDVESIEKDFNKLLIELPEARIDLERYLTSFKVVSKMLEEELQWASITSKGQDTEPKKKNEHEANYEKLEIMLEEIETDARRFGHKAPSFLARKMKSLREAWKNIPNMTDFSAEPSHKDWYRWLDHQLDYITHSYSDCHDKEILGKLKTFLDKFQQLIDSFQSSQDLVGDPSQSDSNLPTTHQKSSDVNSESSGNLETMDRDYSWDALRDKTSNVRMRLEANSGDQMNQLILCLRELIEWVIKRQTELDSMPTIGGDMNTLSQQQQDYSNLRAQLDEKKPVIENTLTSARSCLPKGLPPSEEGIYDIGLDEPSKLARTVQREVNKLSEKWYHLLHNFDQQQRKMDEVMKKMIGLQKQMDDLFVNLHRAEAIKSQWQPISDLILDHLPEQMHELQQFRENIFSIKAQVDQLNETATRITGSNVLLSHTNLNRLEELNTRWKLIQVAIEDRRKGLEQAMIDHGSAQQQFLSSSVEHPWERAVAPNKVPYYINHATETTHWDHPKMTLLMNSLTEFNEIRYSAYRTSMKLRSVQRSLCLDYVHILSLIGIFEEYGLRGENDKLISVPKMINCLQTVYEKACNGGDNAPAVDVPLCIDLCLNWLLNLYDSTSRTGHIRILSFKIGLVTLCKGALEEKYRFMFRLIADSEGFSDERKLAVLLHDLVQVPRLLGEVAAFGGTNIEPSVRSCVERAGNKAEIESIDFLSWLQQEPQSIVWLPVLHRQLTAETAKHQSKCNVCKAYPIVGFRYRCMLCFNFDMCQTCFFFGKTAKNHKNSHPMQEYCLATSSGEDLHDFTRIIRNKFKSKRYFKKRSKCGYLPVQTVLEGDSLESPTVSPSHQSYNGMNSEMDVYTERFAEVELNGHRNPTVNADGTEEEHRLIAQYCQSLNPNHGPSQIPPNPAQIIANIDAEQRDELESMIHQLEEENRALLGEYERLKSEKGNRVILNGSDSYSSLGRRELENEYHSALLLESKALKTSWKELENKRMFLENQNKQLETTLDRLRQFLKPISEASLSPTTAARLRSALGQSRIPPSTPSISSNPGYRMNGSSSDGYYPTDMR